MYLAQRCLERLPAPDVEAGVLREVHPRFAPRARPHGRVPAPRQLIDALALRGNVQDLVRYLRNLADRQRDLGGYGVYVVLARINVGEGHRVGPLSRTEARADY